MKFNLFYILSLKTKKANLFGQKIEIQTSLYFKSKNKKSKFIWSETRNSNLFYILSLKTRKANLFGQKLEIQTSFLCFYILSLKTRKANLFGQKLEIQTSLIF